MQMTKDNSSVLTRANLLVYLKCVRSPTYESIGVVVVEVRDG